MHVLTVKGIMNNMLLLPTCSVPDHSVLAVDLDISDFVNLNSDSGTKEANINVYNNKYNVKGKGQPQ